MANYSFSFDFLLSTLPCSSASTGINNIIIAISLCEEQVNYHLSISQPLSLLYTDLRVFFSFCIILTRVNPQKSHLLPTFLKLSPPAIFIKALFPVEIKVKRSFKMNVDVIASGPQPENSISPSLSHTAESESVSKPEYATGQIAKMPDWNVSNDLAESNNSTSASTFSNETQTIRNDDDCDKMVEKWRLIRLADRNEAQKKVAR